jgi:hypothetical protein
MRKLVRLMVVLGPLLVVPALLSAQITYDAMYVQGRVKELPEKKPGKLDVADATVLQFTWDKGTWKVPFSQIKTVYVSLSRRSAMVEAFGLAGAAIGEAKARKLLLSLNLTDESGTSRNCVFFIRGAAAPQFWKTLESKTGRAAIFESEEARKAAQIAE